MAINPAPVCITCGMSAHINQLNRLSNGQTCPTCRERVLDALPPALPSRAPVSSGVIEMGAEEEGIVSDREHDGGERPWPPTGFGR